MEAGYSKGERGILVMKIPGKKKPCLCVKKGNSISKVATFGSEEDVEVFMMYLKFLLGVDE